MRGLEGAGNNWWDPEEIFKIPVSADPKEIFKIPVSADPEEIFKIPVSADPEEIFEIPVSADPEEIFKIPVSAAKWVMKLMLNKESRMCTVLLWQQSIDAGLDRRDVITL